MRTARLRRKFVSVAAAIVAIAAIATPSTRFSLCVVVVAAVGLTIVAAHVLARVARTLERRDARPLLPPADVTPKSPRDRRPISRESTESSSMTRFDSP